MGGAKVTIDGNEAVAHVAYQVNEVIAIYLTPACASLVIWLPCPAR